MTDKTAPASDLVRIRCTSDRRPWTHEKRLELGEVVDVPPAVAATLKKVKFAEDAKGAQLGIPEPAAETEE